MLRSLAGDLLSADHRDRLSKQLAVLKARILRAIGIDETFRSWSDGLTGDKTFQQVTEDFAEIVIPKVWMREDRNISRVAAKLSISPKKVRRILRSVKLLRRSHPPPRDVGLDWEPSSTVSLRTHGCEA